MYIDLGEIKLQNFQQLDITENYLRWLNDKELMKYSRQSFFDHDIKSAEMYLKTFSNSSNRFLAIKINQTLVGTATVYIDDIYKTCSYGILIGKEFLGNGFGQIVWDFLIKDLSVRLGARKVSVGTLIGNAKMIKIIEKSGMDFEANLKNEGMLEGVPCDILLYRYFV
jgi:RimJ/RimL family protein N-acetyltransferase